MRLSCAKRRQNTMIMRDICEKDAPPRWNLQKWRKTRGGWVTTEGEGLGATGAGRRKCKSHAMLYPLTWTSVEINIRL